MTKLLNVTLKQSPRLNFWRRGEPFVWLTGAALALTLLATALLLLIVLVHGLGTFWPARLVRLSLADGSHVLGEITERTRSADDKGRRLQLKIGNRDLYGLDFRWVEERQVKAADYPPEAVALERREHGNFYGTLIGLKDAEAAGLKNAKDLWPRMLAARAALAPQEKELEALHGRLASLAGRKERLRLGILKLTYGGQNGNAPRVQALEAEGRQIDLAFEEVNKQAGALSERLRRHEALFKDATGQEKAVALVDIMRAYRPNAMSPLAKLGVYFSKVAELLTTGPREANTEGGLLPAIFGTVLMVLMMSLFCIPMGVVAAIYLREYAKEGFLVRLVRIAVNNLAGVPSIVYGVFGLGFFVYGLGSLIDKVFFPERLPTPTFGTGGLLWASLTLALLTVPVVIVATEESLAAIPRAIREGSLALGATKFQTLVRILLPMASPGIMTGLILAMARAAGEVAPLMIVGVVKLAPALPLDGQFPYLHLDRKFMHLGFHIYDVGFQSPNVEAAKPMVFVTTLLLLVIVVLMSAAAVHLRNTMRKKYTTGAF